MNIKKVIVISVLLAVSFTAGAFAATNVQKVDAFLRRDYQVFLDGKKVDVGTVLTYSGSSYLPLAKIAQLTGYDVKWNSANLGIYLNSRFTGQPSAIDEGNLDYDQIELAMVSVYNAKYLGGMHPVLSNLSWDHKRYYRNKDIQRMGIDTRGLRKGYEINTKELYITEEEMKKVWKEKPIFTEVYEPLVFGESDPKKIEVLNNFINGMPEVMRILHQNDPYSYYQQPVVYMMEALTDDEYHILSFEQNGYRQYWLKLKQNINGDWYHSEYKFRDFN